MPSREATLLTDFLLAPAPLRNVMTKTQFVKLFQKQAANPAVPAMYRELHELRERDIATVGQDIADEVRRSTRLKKQYAQQRRQLEDAHVAGLDPVSLGMEQELSGTLSSKPHTLQTVHASISEACVSLEAQIADLEDETRRALEAVQEAVGELSDLRHGRFVQSASGEDVVKQVLENLRQLEAVCTP